jgi:CheY-like chemotaxis protein
MLFRFDEPVARPSQVIESVPRRNLKVLLVDDHPAFRTITVRMLAVLGHLVVDTGDAAEAESLFRSEGDFDLVMVDLLLKGGEGGVDLVQRLDAAFPGVHVLFMSGADIGDGASRPSWLQAPHRSFLAKPFSLAALQAELEALVGDGPESV